MAENDTTPDFPTADPGDAEPRDDATDPADLEGTDDQGNLATVTGTDPETGAPGDVGQVMTRREADATVLAGDAKSAAITTEDQTAAGYFGASPAREMTGEADKGLSQRNASVMNQNPADGS